MRFISSRLLRIIQQKVACTSEGGDRMTHKLELTVQRLMSLHCFIQISGLIISW
jgi:hypothetical protein